MCIKVFIGVVSPQYHACPAFLTADTLAARWLRPHMMDSGPGSALDDFPVLYGYRG
jgi:hypothetical protein